MDFSWRGNQLFTRFGPTGDDDKVWTTFVMDMRKPIEVTNIHSQLEIFFIYLTFRVIFFSLN
jgi:hypothetical protein